MRIAYIVPSLVLKGPVIVVKELVNVMTAHGHECVVYYFDKSDASWLKCGNQRISMSKAIDFDSFDIIHSHGIRPDIYMSIFQGKRHKAKAVTTFHNFIFPDLASQYNRFISIIAGRLWLYAAKSHDKIVALSETGVEYYARWFPKKKLDYAYNTSDVDKTHVLSDEEREVVLDFKGNDTLLGVNALLTPIKGIDLIIKAMPFMEGCKLFIVGSGKEERALRRQAIDLQVSDRIYFAGYHKEAYRYLPFYDVFIVSSLSEGFSLVILEAAQYAKNVVLSDIDVFREFYTDEEAAFFQLGNTRSFVEAVKRAKESKAMGHRLMRRYNELFSPEKFYRKYLDIYKSVLSKTV